MVTTSTSINNVNHFKEKSEKLNSELFEEFDSMFYENIKCQMDELMRDPADETIAKILAYSKAK